MSHKIFVTGATGYLGSAIAARLRRTGHTVHGLTRDGRRAELLAAQGIHPVIAGLNQPQLFLPTLKNCDMAVHVAFDSNAVPTVDLMALDAFRVAATDGRLRRLLYTSGIWVHGDTGQETLDETAPLRPLEHSRWRAAHEDIALDLGSHEVETVIFRPGIVYGERRGIIGGMFAEAHEHSRVRYPGDGTQRWALVHRDDVAEAYALGLEHAKHEDRFLLVDGASHTAADVATAIAAATGAALAPWPADEVVARLGDYGRALLASTGFSSAKARRELGWVPRHASFVSEAGELHREWESSAGASVQ